MLDIATELHRWCRAGRDFAVATVVSVGGSAPRQPGAALAVDAGGEVVGSVSGGCVEGAVYELCREALESGAAGGSGGAGAAAGARATVERFGFGDEDAFAVGLTCGGVLDVLVAPYRAEDPSRAALTEALGAAVRGEPVAVARVVDGPPELLGGAPLFVRPGTARAAGGARAAAARTGGLGGHPLLDATVAAEAGALLEAGRTGTVEVGASGSRCGRPVTVLVESSVPPPRMLVFGAVDFAGALARAGSFLGYRVTVCDARPVFATAARFPDAHEVVAEWPHRYLDRQVAEQSLDVRTAICVLTHDAKFDVPLLERALRLPVGYVGAMGSRRTHEDRLARLREAGLGERELAALHSPIGLDLGARTPEETALSITAEIVAGRHGGSGRPLTGAHTPIHHEGPDAHGRREGPNGRAGSGSYGRTHREGPETAAPNAPALR